VRALGQLGVDNGQPFEARREEKPTSDIDLMVIGRIELAELARALKRAEEILLRPVNPSIYTPLEEIAEKLAAGHRQISRRSRSSTPHFPKPGRQGSRRCCKWEVPV